MNKHALALAVAPAVAGVLLVPSPASAAGSTGSTGDVAGDAPPGADITYAAFTHADGTDSMTLDVVGLKQTGHFRMLVSPQSDTGAQVDVVRRNGKTSVTCRLIDYSRGTSTRVSCGTESTTWSVADHRVAVTTDSLFGEGSGPYAYEALSVTKAGWAVDTTSTVTLDD